MFEVSFAVDSLIQYIKETMIRLAVVAELVRASYLIGVLNLYYKVEGSNPAVSCVLF